MTQPAENLSVANSPVESASDPAAATLGMWSTYDWGEEVRLDQLSAGDQIAVTTRNHVYDVIVTSPWTGDVLVRGGRFFPEFTRARLTGSSLGGSVLKIHSANVGFRLEFTADGSRPVITTPVRTIRVVRVAADRDVM